MMYTVRGSRAAITMLMILVSMFIYMLVNQESSVLAFSSTKTPKTMTNMLVNQESSVLAFSSTKTPKTMTNNSSPTIKNRREVLARIIGGTGIAALELAWVAAPAEAKAKKEGTVTMTPAIPAVPVPAPETEQEKQARIMKEKIAESKINYRKAESKDKSPFRLLENK